MPTPVVWKHAMLTSSTETEEKTHRADDKNTRQPCFGTKASSCPGYRTSDDRREEARLDMSRDLCAEDGAFKKVPAEVDAYCPPQTTSQYVESSGEDTPSNHKRYGTHQGCIGICQMDETKKDGASSQSNPGT